MNGAGPRLRAAAMLGVLTALLPVDLTIAGVAAAIGRLRPGPPIERAAHPRTVLLTGGKMTKSLTLARAFGRAGHRVVLVETAKYRWCGHRFSNCVDAFHVVPDPDDPGYPDAIATVVATEGVDVFVPVCSPLASRYDALAAARLPDHVEVIHAAHDVIGILDDKDRFAASAAELGLRVPETHRITSVADVLGFDFAARPDRRYLLKSIPYDPVHRADLTTLPLATSELTADHVRSLPISDERPWILQEFVDGDEYCTHGTVRSGVTTVWACCRSSAKQLNYEMVERPDIEAWVSEYVSALGVTGQLSFDFIIGPHGEPVAIECNPRTHSAITMFAGHPSLADGYLRSTDGPDSGDLPIVPIAGSRPTYWLHMEWWRMLSEPRTAHHRLREIVRGRDAILDPHDPLPFVLVPHLHIASLLVGALRTGSDWVGIDVNIGKLVEPDGD